MSTASQTYVPSVAQTEPPSLADDVHALEQQESTKESRAYALAYHLPPELLVHVFVLLQNIWRSRRETKLGLSPRRFSEDADISRLLTYVSGWTTVLHVCAFWRKVALSAPILWQEVDATVIHPDSIHEFLTRSAGLDVRLTVDDTHSRYLAIAFDESVLRRIETLAFRWSGRKDQVPQLLSQTTPNIRKLVLHSNRPTLLPPELLDSACPPRLRQLSLTFCSLTSDSSLFAHALTHLKLYSVKLDDKHLDSVAKILSLLAILPSLEYLHLDFLMSNESADTTLRQVSLPCLNYLSFNLSDDPELPPTSSILLMQHLTTSASTEIIVHTEHSILSDWTTLQQLSSAAFLRNYDGDLHVQLVLISYYEWNLYRWDPVAKTRVDGKCINVTLDTEPDMFYPELGDRINSVRPQSLVVLGETWEELSEYPWIWDNMSEMEDVLSLTVCYCDHEHLWPLLEKQPELFPHLDTVILTDNHSWWPCYSAEGNKNEFGGAVPDVHECEIDADMLAAVVSSLTATVQQLQSAGLPLQEVRMEGTAGSWDGWDTLRTAGDLGDLNLVTVAPTSS